MPPWRSRQATMRRTQTEYWMVFIIPLSWPIGSRLQRPTGRTWLVRLRDERLWRCRADRHEDEYTRVGR